MSLRSDRIIRTLALSMDQWTDELISEWAIRGWDLVGGHGEGGYL
jgi:hypothetical protein